MPQPQPGTAAPTPVAPPKSVPGETATAYYKRGHKLLEDGHFAEAIQQLDEAVRLDPRLALAYNARGFAHYRLKQYGEAVADFNSALGLNPAYANAYLNRSVARRASGDAAGADADAAKARQLTAKTGK
jgi:tetratricopeptide (TPR) repeat protein